MTAVAQRGSGDGSPEPLDDLPLPEGAGPDRPRRRGRWAALVVVVLLVGAAVGAAFSPLLAVRTVELSGAGTLSRAEVLAAARVAEGDPMVRVSLRQVRARLRALPAVASARVEREWPTTLRIVLTLERPLVAFVAPGRTVVVSSNGRVLSTGPDAARVARTTPRVAVDTLPALAEGAEVPADLLDVAEIHAEATPQVLAELVAGRLRPNGDVEFRSPRGGRIVFGPAEDVPAKLLAVSTVLGGRVVRDCLNALDVRDPSRPTVSRTPGCALPAPTTGPGGQPSGGRPAPQPGRLVCTKVGCKVVGGPSPTGGTTGTATAGGTGGTGTTGQGTGGSTGGRLVCTAAGCKVVGGTSTTGGTAAGGSTSGGGTVGGTGSGGSTTGTSGTTGATGGGSGADGGRLVCTRAGCTVVGGRSGG